MLNMDDIKRLLTKTVFENRICICCGERKLLEDISEFVCFECKGKKSSGIRS